MAHGTSPGAALQGRCGAVQEGSLAGRGVYAVKRAGPGGSDADTNMKTKQPAIWYYLTI